MLIDVLNPAYYKLARDQCVFAIMVAHNISVRGSEGLDLSKGNSGRNEGSQENYDE
jgi:hypothetical protein